MSEVGTATILLVDDRPENLIALEAILEPLGQPLTRANSGEEALRHVLTTDFAVILLDVQMPGLNGFETAQMIKSRERSRHTPIIFLTAINKEDRYVFEGYSVGAVDYMFKPFQPDVLRSKVAVFVELYLKNQQLQEQGELLRDAERRELELRHQAELHESEARTAEIVASVAEAIITVDEERRVRLFNAAAQRMFGRSADHAIGRPLDELLHERFRGEELQALLASAATAGESQDSRVLAGVRADGREFPMEASVSRMTSRDEALYTVVARDVTERRRAEEALRVQAEELRALNQKLHTRQRELEAAMGTRSRFYASMSHELRTPINAIMGYNDLLLATVYGPLSDAQIKGIERSQKAARHLLELVNDVLDLSKLEAGKVELMPEEVSIPALVDDLFTTIRPLAEERGCPLDFDRAGCARRIMTDPRRVRQILLNLLSNAIKFGAGKPVGVTCVETEDGGVALEVADHGPGIASEDADRVFEEFVQLKGHQQQGTGLGLPISQRLARLLGGSLTLESTPGEGSTFRLVLPAETAAVVAA